MQEDHNTENETSPKHSLCSCGGDKRNDSPIPNLSTHYSVIDSFEQLFEAFQPSLDKDEKKQWGQFANSLILSSTAFERLANSCETLTHEERGSRSVLAEKLASHFGNASKSIRSSGAYCLSSDDSSTLTSKTPAFVEGAFQDIAALLLKSAVTGGIGPLQAYSESWSKFGYALADFLAILVEQAPASSPSDELLASYTRLQSVSSTAYSNITQLMFFGTYAFLGLPASSASCPPECPIEVCYSFARDIYSNPTGCGPWTERSTGLFSSGGWEIECTWVIDTVVYKLCWCYKGFWDAFWAVDNCSSTKSSTIVKTRTDKYTWFIANKRHPVSPSSVMIPVPIP